MGSVNKIILVGNLGRDAELRYTPGGMAVATANMATTEVWTDKSGQKQERTEWHRVSIWGRQAESLQQYLTKGKQIFVEGRLQTRKVPKCRKCDAFLSERDWNPTDKGTKVRCRDGHEEVPYTDTMVDIKADRVTLLGGGGGAGGGAARGATRGEPADSGEPPVSNITDDDIPF